MKKKKSFRYKVRFFWVWNECFSWKVQVIIVVLGNPYKVLDKGKVSFDDVGNGGRCG